MGVLEREVLCVEKDMSLLFVESILGWAVSVSPKGVGKEGMRGEGGEEVVEEERGEERERRGWGRKREREVFGGMGRVCESNEKKNKKKTL